MMGLLAIKLELDRAYDGLTSVARRERRAVKRKKEKERFVPSAA
jgi:hypothetical protein